ncbi:hypothetical protein BJX99DRAFT_255329 [Aspergillus californicus]
MNGRLKKRSLRPHVIAPVLLFSVIGQNHVRVMEAYSDEAKLVMRTTPLFDLQHASSDLLQTLTKWRFGGASAKPTTLDDNSCCSLCTARIHWR